MQNQDSEFQERLRAVVSGGRSIWPERETFGAIADLRHGRGLVVDFARS